MARAKLADVAKMAEVSTASVSRYLNGSLVLPKETSDRIDAAISELDYRPHPHARRLSRGRSDIIALVVPEIANPFFAQLASAAERAVGERGYRMMLFATDNRLGRELDYLVHLVGADVDGVLFVTNHTDAGGELAQAIAKNSRVVILDENIDGVDAPRVFVDNFSAGRLAAEKFLEFGHRDFAYIGGPDGLMSVNERGEGFRSQLAPLGERNTRLRILLGDYSPIHGAQAMNVLLDEGDPPTAILTGSDAITLGILEVCHERNIRIPDDISLITIDDVLPNRFMTPAISAIRQPIAQMGQVGVDSLLALIDGSPETVAPVTRLPVEFIARKSVAAPREGCLKASSSKETSYGN
ncbi:LacI family transcriptional regulator [Sinirhodobacter populi]|uniref:LacI family transcriptional regulator n=1 Tax=Paenirhodobacter populi TaxID=2306993 RepID=A0A443K2T4_9RHOB|nr:LacI family DNA-binding transcriptional regulator [Sinirhodobacter populi]RWR27070.1 LacI family transcriptional regulator [Sinirhodobacter populi]